MPSGSSRAEGNGLKAGDIVFGVGRLRVNTLAELSQLVKRRLHQVQLVVARGGDHRGADGNRGRDPCAPRAEREAREAQAVRDQLTRHAGTTPANGASAPHPDLLADQVASQVLGLGFADLGMGVARHWGLPESLQHCMRRPEGHSPPRALPPGPERLRWLSLAANEAAEAIWRSDDDTLPKALDAVVQRHGRALGLGLTELKQAGENARGTLAQMAAAMGLTLPRNRLASTDAAMPPVTIAAREASVDMLAAGIQDIADALASESVPLSALLHMVLETIYRALACQRVVFCLRDASGQRLTGRFGLGDQAKLLSPRFDIPLRTVSGQPPDLFGAVCLKGVDTLVPDLQRRDVEAMLPTWFRQRVVARSMLLLPLVLRGAPLGLIYADHAMRMPLGERERVKLHVKHGI